MKKKNKKLNWFELKKIFKIYFFIIIPVILIFIFFYSYASKVQLEKTKEIIIGEQRQKAITIDYVVKDILKELNEDLFLIKDSYELNTFINNSNEQNLKRTKQMFLNIVENKKNFDQIRFINDNGEEIIRVNNIKNKSILVKNTELQNKKNRDYYKKTSELKNGQIFISDMDLNVENGKVEKPYKPIIRVATPMYSKTNVYKGVLIINYLGNDILSIFNEQFNILDYDFIEASLVNKDGYYLYSSEEEYNFGFMFQDKKDITVLNKFPNLWKSIILKKDGIFEKNGEVNFFMTIDPFEKLNVDEKSKYSWIVISKFNLKSLPSVKDKIIFGMRFVDIIIVFSIIILIFIITVITFYKIKDKERLNVILRIADNTKDAMVITDKNTNIVYINKAYEKITGYKKDEVIGLQTGYFKSGLHSNEFYKNMWKDINQKGSWSGEIWDRKKNGLFYPKKLSILKEIKNGAGTEHYIGVFNDLTENKKREKLMNYNKVTELPNENLLEKLILKSLIEKEDKFVLVSFSIVNYNDLILEYEDNFEDYLKDFIKNIRQIIDKTDFIAQLSKNNFIVGVKGFNNKKEVNFFIEKNLRKVLEQYKNKILFDIKIGVSIYPDDGKELKNLLNNVQMALEKSIKTDNKITFYTKKLRTDINKEMEIILLLESAILNDEFKVYYQPQVQINNGKVSGVEALIRWKNDKLGNISPVVFISIAEKTGQIIEIGYWIIEQVFKDFLLIKDKINLGFRISINISPLQFKDPNLLYKFKELADLYNINLNYFEIEITEGIFIEDIETINFALDKFRKMGLTIAIDDFGTGFSSLSYLKDLNIDKIKIDRSFIRDYPDKDNGVIAKVVTNIAKELDLDVITEGVENEVQVNYIESIGCNLIQGYYYSKPLTFELLVKYLVDKS